MPSGQKRCQAAWLRRPRRLLLRLARFNVLSIGRLSGQRQPARRYGGGQVFTELVGLGRTPVGGDADRLQGNYLSVADAPLPEPARPRAVKRKRAAFVKEAVVQRRGIFRRLRQQEEGVLLESELRLFRVG